MCLKSKTVSYPFEPSPPTRFHLRSPMSSSIIGPSPLPFGKVRVGLATPVGAQGRLFPGRGPKSNVGDTPTPPSIPTCRDL